VQAALISLSLGLSSGCDGSSSDTEVQALVDMASSGDRDGGAEMSRADLPARPVDMSAGSVDMSGPDMGEQEQGNPLEDRVEVKKVEFSKMAGKIDNPIWYQAASRLVFNNDGVQGLSNDGAVESLYVLEDGSAHSPKTVDREGDLLGLYFPVAGEVEEHIVRFDGQGAVKETLASAYRGHRLPHANDMAVGVDGTVYFTQRRGKPEDDYLENRNGSGALFRVSPAGEVVDEVNSTTLQNFRNPNGIAVSPDGRTLYVGTSDYDERSHAGLWRFGVDADGTLGAGQFLGKAGRPDGICVDVRENIYISNGGGKRLHVMSPDGELWGQIELPHGSHTNCGFGGAQGQTLYVSTQRALFSVELPVKGELYSRQQ